jgi:hypothetical protein
MKDSQEKTLFVTLQSLEQYSKHPLATAILKSPSRKYFSQKLLEVMNLQALDLSEWLIINPSNYKIKNLLEKIFTNFIKFQQPPKVV